MANAAEVATKRDEIGQRWLRGQPVSQIARETGVPLGTVKHDLAVIRRAMLAGQGDVLRLARARTMATVELVAAQAWQRIDALSGQAEPDEQAISGYLNVVLKAQMQAAKIAGLLVGQPDGLVQKRVIDRDITAWIEEHDPDVAAQKAYNRELDKLIYESFPTIPTATPTAKRKRAARNGRTR
jgi:hypothetical protein